MSQPLKDVDFGSAYLDAGLQDGVADGAALSPDPAALALFERHMGGGHGQGHGRGSAGFGPGPWEMFDALRAPLPTAGIEVAPDAAGSTVGGFDAGSDALAAAVQELWVAHGADGRELRLRVQPLGHLLADTSLRMVEEGGRLAIEFDAGEGESRAWLSQRLRGLAGHLGRQLDRPLRVSLSSPPFARAADAPASESVQWPEDFDA